MGVRHVQPDGRSPVADVARSERDIRGRTPGSYPVVGSLFSGVGGLDLGLALAGWQHGFLCESDEWRRGVLRARFPGVPVYDDVRGIANEQSGRGNDRADATGGEQPEPRGHGWPARLDLLCGGFPCQDLSVAGKRAGIAGERSGLFHEFARCIDAFRPGWVLVENVPGLLSSNGGRDFGIVLGTLADLGYGVAWRVLDSRFFGVPQRRRRVFILGAVAGSDSRAAAERAGEVLAVGSRCDRHLATRGEAGPDVAYALADGSGARTGSGRDGQDTLIAAPLSHGLNPNSNMAGRRREDDDAQPSEDAWPTLRVEGGGHAVQSGASVRRLTPTECERLQALPDGWTDPHGDAPDSRRYAALGDAVTASVAYWIGARLLAHLSRQEAA